MPGRARENYSAVTASTTIEEYVTGKDPFRVTHGLPLPLPPRMGVCHPELQKLFEEKVQPPLPNKLSRYSISPTKTDLQYLLQFDRSGGLNTLVIETEGENTTV
jgi:hypothetical protein